MLQGAVKLHAVLLAMTLVGLPQFVRVDWIFGLDVARVVPLHLLGDLALERLQRLAGERVDPPGLQIAAGGGAGGLFDQFAQQRGIDGVGAKGPATDPAVDRGRDVHACCFLAISGRF